MLLLSTLKYWWLFLLTLIGEVGRVDFFQAALLGSGGDLWSKLAEHHCSLFPLG